MDVHGSKITLGEKKKAVLSGDYSVKEWTLNQEEKLRSPQKSEQAYLKFTLM